MDPRLVSRKANRDSPANPTFTPKEEITHSTLRVGLVGLLVLRKNFMFTDQSPIPPKNEPILRLQWFTWLNYTLFAENDPSNTDARNEIDKCLDEINALSKLEPRGTLKNLNEGV